MKFCEKVLFFVCFSFFLFVNGFCQAQPYNAQWPFYLAFEDATGAKDTMWFVMDESATSGFDEAFGETPILLNDTSFNVWRFRNIGDQIITTFDCNAFPMQPLSVFISIEANNYILPITVRWDADLLLHGLDQFNLILDYADLINSYLFLMPGSSGFYNINDSSIASEVVLPEFDWGSSNHFPLVLGITVVSKPLSTADISNNQLGIYPNPVSGFLNLQIPSSDGNISSVSLWDMSGRNIMKFDHIDDSRIDLSSLPPGIYIVQVKTRTKLFSEKVVVMR